MEDADVERVAGAARFGRAQAVRSSWTIVLKTATPRSRPTSPSTRASWATNSPGATPTIRWPSARLFMLPLGSTGLGHRRPANRRVSPKRTANMPGATICSGPCRRAWTCGWARLPKASATSPPREAHRRVNRLLPLETAARYGVPLPLDREGVAQELGFDRGKKIMQVQAARPLEFKCWGAGKRCRKFAG